MRFLAPYLLVVAALSGCQAAEPAHPAMWPAMWEVTGPQGEHGWLFGTIHLLPHKADWRTPAVNRALAGADLVVLEIAAIDDEAHIQQAFSDLAHTPGQPPLSQRIDPALRPALTKLLGDNRLKDTGFADLETWAVALRLAQLAHKGGDADNGIDRAILKAAPELPRAEFEGAAVQLAIFDRLSEQDQRDLLSAVLRDDPRAASQAQLADAWRKGDMDFIARQTRSGILADQGIRKALYEDRNLAWQAQFEALLRQGRRPFVAVGAAHLAGPDGLPAMLAARGWKVARIQ